MTINYHTKKPYLLLMIVLTISVSCEKSKHCKGRSSDTISGIIVSTFSFGNCFDEYFAPLSEYVINDTTDYKSIGLTRYDNIAGCQTATYPTIDFSQYTLLGKKASGGGCNIGFKREVIRNDANKQYVYNITVCKYGICKKEEVGMNWVLVPKLPQGYTVEFDVKEY